MSYPNDNVNLLHELASALAASGDHSTAIPLRKLARAGYASLEQVDEASDWLLLSFPGMGAKRLGRIRALTRRDWHPPTAQSIKVTGWYLTAARFALRFWPAEVLSQIVDGSSLKADPQGPPEMRLALDVFTQATRDALCHCDRRELLLLLRQASDSNPLTSCHVPWTPGDDFTPRQSGRNGRALVTAADTSRTVAPGSASDEETDHYAYPHQRRRSIVQHYRVARSRGEVKNKDAWAQTNYGISGRTLFNYEREFPEAESNP
jgi:hypothetical protein